ncbi:MAG TPA: flagellar biosynthesis protein FlhB [Pirellulaceae bacterium]|nr:flagellar biosynthesis protein FlhB [Pirellulaceae bacterium]HMO92868.1 flagellar biosynthesis protein FlhB [Pirellulaceae bacterium]
MSDERTSDQRTEEATPRRLERALEEGQIAFSSELLSGLTLLTAMLFFLLVGKWFFDMIKSVMRERIIFVEPMIHHPETLLLALRRDVTQLGIACLAIIVPITIVVLVASFLQTRFNISLKPMELKWGKMNPVNGMKRIFSSRAIVRGAVAIAKAACIVAAVYYLTIARLGDVASSGQSTLSHGFDVGAQFFLSIGLLSAGLMLFVGVIDYGFQWWKHRRDLRMTLQEVRDEHKQTEGDPQVRARIRRVASELSKKRMMKAVPTSTVVVTNPTHYAVALKYVAEENTAPIVVAKGADHLAQQIIRIAKEHGVAIVERKSIARYLYANVKLGQEIPYELFPAVAEILNFIRRFESR